MDDTTFLLQELEDMQSLLDRQQLAGIYTHLHTSTLKLVGIIISKEGNFFQFHHLDLRSGGGKLTLVSAKDYARLLG